MESGTRGVEWDKRVVESGTKGEWRVGHKRSGDWDKSVVESGAKEEWSVGREEWRVGQNSAE